MLPRRILLAAILICSLLTASCLKDAAKTIGELQGLQAELNKRFSEDIYLNLNHFQNRAMLGVTFINSPLNERTPQERAKRAEEAAQIVNTHYAGSTLVTDIYVMFVRRKTQFGLFHYTEGIENYGFERHGQQLRRATPYWPAPMPEREITAGYSGTSGLTDVSPAANFQLYEEPGGGNYGITVLPHFELQGDATRRRGLAPNDVSFYFASYAKKPRFGGEVPYEFIADGKPVLQGKAPFSGKDAEYCTVKIPYSVFRKLVAAQAVTIKLGAKEYPLTPLQLVLLQKMDAYVLN